MGPKGGVVTEDLLGKAAEMSEGSLEPLERVVLPLRRKGQRPGRRAVENPFNVLPRIEPGLFPG